VQLLALDCCPERRGLAASCDLAIQQLALALASALLLPLLLDSALRMALGMAGMQLLGALMLWTAWRK
jgi:DHA1 family bicyclomycin/chloramphenicol resistance-like MFS transporter